MNYRNLTDTERLTLQQNDCWAEDWQRIMVAEEGFQADRLRRVAFYGEVKLGRFLSEVEVSKGFFKTTGVYDATLRNVSVGDECLIERIGGYINNYTIGRGCVISNVSLMETTEGATYGENHTIAVLNEAGDGNVISFHGLNSQLAAFMVKHEQDKDLRNALRRLIAEELTRTTCERGTLGENVKITNTTEIINTVVHANCEIAGASRLSDCTIMSSENSSVYIGVGVICENTIIGEGTSITNSAKLQDCFVGEACQITNGFSASQSVFFANSHFANGEACAAFCGPFSTSHHKSTLLIGGMFSFYNAGSATNFSNHAYKMGPLHWGLLERGTKTASGSHLLMPAKIGAFSVCIGKITTYPDTTCLPFSYVIGSNEGVSIVPGRNLTTVGVFRDIHKWRKRDLRPIDTQKSIINFDWLSPYTAMQIWEGKQILEQLIAIGGQNSACYQYAGMTIKHSSLVKGIAYYDLALRLYIGEMCKRATEGSYTDDTNERPLTDRWSDLGGFLLPEDEEFQIISDIKDGSLETIEDVLERFTTLHQDYDKAQWGWTRSLIKAYYGIDEISTINYQTIAKDYATAHKQWIEEIEKDAQREFALGDVDEHVLEDFLAKLEKEKQVYD